MTARQAVGPEGARENRPVTDTTPSGPRARAHEIVLSAVERDIATGRLRVGDRLPGERDFAAQLGVSRPSVREAVRALEAMGVVRAAVGQGTDGGTIVIPGSSTALTRLLRLHIGLSTFPMPDAIDARVMLERWSCRLAAQEATPEELDLLRETLASMRRPDISHAEFNDLDTRFHVQIADAGHNRLVADMTTAIRDAMHWWIMQSFAQRDDWDDLVIELRAGHEAVFESIEAHRPAEAAERVEAHIRSSYALLHWTRGTD